MWRKNNQLNLVNAVPLSVVLKQFSAAPLTVFCTALLDVHQSVFIHNKCLANGFNDIFH